MSVQSTIHLLLALHFHQPTGVSRPALERGFEERYRPLLAKIEEHRSLRTSLHFAGPILEHAAEAHPTWLSRLRELQNEGRIEVLGGAFHDALLPLIPERDALSQLQFAANFHRTHFERRPKGAWLCLRAWKPELVHLLAASRLEYALLDDSLFIAAGLDPDSVYGHFVDGRGEERFTAFPADRLLEEVAYSGDLEALDQALGARAALGSDGSGPGRLHVLALEADRLVAGGRLPALLDHLASRFHWIKTHTGQRAASMFPSRGRLPLGAGADAELALHARLPRESRREKAFQERMRRAGVWEDVRRRAGPAPVESFLVKYPEAARIHTRMLRLSTKIERLRELLAERQSQGAAGVRAAREVLRKTCGALWRAQNHSVYWYGGARGVGIYDPVLRQRVARELLASERVVDRLLGAADKAWESRIDDIDGDGVPEAVVATPDFHLAVSPNRGGTLWELDLRKRGLPLQTSMDGGEEPEHQGVSDTAVVLVDGDEIDRSIHDGPVVPELAELSLGHARRGAFQDHFFAPEATVENWARRSFPEVGDFAGRPYELIRVEGPEGERDGAVRVGRSAAVRAGSDHSLLLRVEREFRPASGRPQLEIVRSLSNRSREPAAVWYGLEWTFGLPGARAERVRLRVYDEDEVERRANLAQGPVDLGRVTWVEWVDQAAKVAVVFELSEPMGLWWAPVRTVVMGPEGWRSIVQGNSLLLHQREELWGQDSRECRIKLSFLEP